MSVAVRRITLALGNQFLVVGNILVVDKTLQLLLHGDQQLFLHGDLPHTVKRFSVRQLNASKGSMRAVPPRIWRATGSQPGHGKSKDGIRRFANGLSKIMLPEVSPKPSHKCPFLPQPLQ